MQAEATVPNAEAVDEAARHLRSGGLVAFPTETVYGLGADATNPVAVAEIYRVKGRPSTHPLIVHVGDAGELDRWASSVPAAASRLAGALWPGPLTLVLSRHPRLAADASGGLGTVALRMPDHPVARALLDRSGRPIAAPSANRFGRVSPTTAADVRAEFGDAVPIVLDGGPSRVGVESTIVELVGPEPVLLRPGGVPVEVVEAVLGVPVRRRPAGPARAPGMLPSHYAPRAAVVLARPDELRATIERHRDHGLVAVVAPDAVLASLELPDGCWALGAPVDDEVYARQLYRYLRDADEGGAAIVIAVAPPRSGLGLAVADRLTRAAAPRC
ncbi:MAG: L-threonylcarbamoyladenylate synthase [Acidimicrobiia bacterium]|nr:L-threonylcarbamoyladenylate synthase [Acidimicrobiia bacterium]